MFLERSPDDPEQRREIAARIKAMVEASQTLQVVAWVPCGDCFRGRRSEIRERPIDRPQDAFHITVCKGGCDEAGNLLVAWILVPVDKLYRIVSGICLPGLNPSGRKKGAGQNEQVGLA